MMKAALLSALVGLVQAASTKVSVLEFGKGGAVHRTNSKSATTTVDGVVSFWKALHSRKLQKSGMSIVPDLFVKPESGVVIGISGNVDLDEMPFLTELLISEDASNVVGHLEVPGSRCHALMSNVEWEEVTPEALSKATISHGEKAGLSGVKTVVDSKSALTVDKHLGSIFEEFNKIAEKNKETIVVHLVVEEEKAVSRRRLEDEQANEEGENNEEAENAEDDKEYNGYYGYGYYNDYGEWVTPFKTMFQIQYFNVVLWTSVGLAFALFYTIFLMVYMPLEPDTLLFGESAKLVGDD